LAVRAVRENATDVNRSKVNWGYLFVQMNEELGMTQEEIATEIGQKREFVKLCLMAAKSAPDIQQMVFEKPDSVRAMTYLRRIKPNIETAEDATISAEEQAVRESEAAALRAPIIARFLSGDLSTDGVQAEVEQVLASLEQQKQEMPSETSFVAEISVVNPVESKTDTMPIPSAVVHLTHPEREEATLLPSKPSTVTTVPASSRNQEEVRLSERIGQAKAALGRLKTYQRTVGDDTPTYAERIIIEEVERIVHQLLGSK
jgi:hypothetical protein